MQVVETVCFALGVVGESIARAWDWFWNRVWTWGYELRNFIEGNW